MPKARDSTRTRSTTPPSPSSRTAASSRSSRPPSPRTSRSASRAAPCSRTTSPSPPPSRTAPSPPITATPEGTSKVPRWMPQTTISSPALAVESAPASDAARAPGQPTAIRAARRSGSTASDPRQQAEDGVEERALVIEEEEHRDDQEQRPARALQHPRDGHPPGEGRAQVADAEGDQHHRDGDPRRVEQEREPSPVPARGAGEDHQGIDDRAAHAGEAADRQADAEQEGSEGRDPRRGPAELGQVVEQRRGPAGDAVDGPGGAGPQRAVRPAGGRRKHAFDRLQLEHAEHAQPEVRHQ